MNFTAKNPEDLPAIAEKIIKNAGENRLFALYGEMGVGKTTLILQLIKVLNVEDEGSSPTFSIVNEYRTKKGEAVYHFDLYRIENEEELFDIGYEEYFFSGSYCFIEWPENAGGLLPDDVVQIHISERKGMRSIEMELPS
jgi:tRNA threonylcarbamoyladenosine biosynthesis protein TsaE